MTAPTSFLLHGLFTHLLDLNSVNEKKIDVKIVKTITVISLVLSYRYIMLYTKVTYSSIC